MITLTNGQPGLGMTLSVCGPSDINGAGPVMTAPPVPGPGVRISHFKNVALDSGIPLSVLNESIDWARAQGLASAKKSERANRLKRAARACRERSE